MRMRRFKSGWNPWTIPYVLHEVHMEFFALSVPDFAAMRHGTVAVRRVCKSWYRPGLILMLMCHALILCAATDEEIEKMIREGLQAWSSGQRAQMWARPHCEKAPWLSAKSRHKLPRRTMGTLSCTLLFVTSQQCSGPIHSSSEPSWGEYIHCMPCEIFPGPFLP